MGNAMPMVIPSCKREKVIQVFADYRLPTDIALEAANSNGELHIRVARHNLFYQHERTKKDRPAVLRPVFLPTGA